MHIQKNTFVRWQISENYVVQISQQFGGHLECYLLVSISAHRHRLAKKSQKFGTIVYKVKCEFYNEETKTALHFECSIIILQAMFHGPNNGQKLTLTLALSCHCNIKLSSAVDSQHSNIP